jgi:hypothetical protein
VIEVIAIFIAAADRENAGTKDAIERMRHPFLFTLVRKQPGKAFDDPDTLLRQSQQRRAAIRRQPAAVESRDHLLRLDGWQGEGQKPIVGHGGCGRLGFVEESV